MNNSLRETLQCEKQSGWWRLLNLTANKPNRLWQFPGNFSIHDNLPVVSSWGFASKADDGVRKCRLFIETVRVAGKKMFSQSFPRGSIHTKWQWTRNIWKVKWFSSANVPNMRIEDSTDARGNGKQGGRGEDDRTVGKECKVCWSTSRRDARCYVAWARLRDRKEKENGGIKGCI